MLLPHQHGLASGLMRKLEGPGQPWGRLSFGFVCHPPLECQSQQVRIAYLAIAPEAASTTSMLDVFTCHWLTQGKHSLRPLLPDSQQANTPLLGTSKRTSGRLWKTPQREGHKSPPSGHSMGGSVQPPDTLENNVDPLTPVEPLVGGWLRGFYAGLNNKNNGRNCH